MRHDTADILPLGRHADMQTQFNTPVNLHNKDDVVRRSTRFELGVIAKSRSQQVLLG